MPLDSSRLSAVARRRLLHDHQSATSSDTGSDSATRVQRHRTKRVKHEPEPASSLIDVDQEISRDHKIAKSTTTGLDANENQFQPLVATQAVKFSGTREVEQIDSRILKIRLSRGQKCGVVGQCMLWVKVGSISVYGAQLHASTETYKIYATRFHGVMQIEATTKQAEFELSNVHDFDFLKLLGSGRSRDLWTLDNTEEIYGPQPLMPGLTFQLDPTPDRSLYLELSYLKPLASLTGRHSVNGNEGVATIMQDSSNDFPDTSRLLLYGRQPTETSVYLHALINHYLTIPDGARNSAKKKSILVLDLEPGVPEFTPPGTVTLVQISEPILGPQFTHPATVGNNTRRIVKMHFTGILQDASMSSILPLYIENLIRCIDQDPLRHKGSPLIIRSSSVLDELEQSAATKALTTLRPTEIVVCGDMRQYSSNWTPWKAILEDTGPPIRYVANMAMHQQDNARKIHTLQMQSYFHLSPPTFDHVRWTDVPVLAPDQTIRSFSYLSPSPCVAGIILLDGNVAVEDTVEAIMGGLVAIVLVDQSFQPIHASANLDEGERNGELYQLTYTRYEKLPRLVTNSRNPYPMNPQKSHCVGLALIDSVEADEGIISLITPVDVDLLDEQIRSGDRIVLVAPGAGRHGRFATEWMRKETLTNSSESSTPRNRISNETASTASDTQEEG